MSIGLLNSGRFAVEADVEQQTHRQVMQQTATYSGA
jgi:hypothetical protein